MIVMQLGKLDNDDEKIKDSGQILDMPPPWSPKIQIDKDAFIKGTPLGESTTFYIRTKV